MRFWEITTHSLHETSSIDDVRTELIDLFTMMKIKDIASVSIDKIKQQISFNNDEELINIITGIDNIVDKIENNIVYLKVDNIPDYSASPDTKEKTKNEITKDAKTQAAKNIKKD